MRAYHLLVDGFLTNSYVLTKGYSAEIIGHVAKNLGVEEQDRRIVCFTSARGQDTSVCYLPLGHLTLHSISSQKVFYFDALSRLPFKAGTVVDVLHEYLPILNANISMITRAFPLDKPTFATTRYTNEERGRSGLKDMN